MADLLIGFALGLAIGSLALRLGVSRYIQNKLALRKLISEMYHKDLMPEICRIEGLLDLSLRSSASASRQFTELALREIQALKQRVSALIKKYEKLQ